MPLGMLGKYERLDVLGHGVSGIVYLARDTMLGKQVALKEVDVQAGDARRFLEEARVLDRLRHPNIVRVNGVDRIDGKIVIDMEYVRGQNLQERLRAEGSLPLAIALDIAAQTLDALHYAHTMQTVHRDIKPANILVGRDGTVKLVDFGLAEILATNAYAGGAGTYAYMAPEDFAEGDHSDHRSDIWAVGVTLYEMVTGNRPFQVSRVKDPFAWKRTLEQENPTPVGEYLPEAPADLNRIFTKALARDKADRYSTAAAFRDDILQLATSLPDIDSVERKKRKQEAIVSAVSRDANETRTAERTGTAGGTVVSPKLEETPPKTKKEKRQRPPSEDQEVPASRLRIPFTAKKAMTPRLIVEPEKIDLGTVHKGEGRTARINATIEGLESSPEGRIRCSAEWLSVNTTAFDRKKQTVTLSADSSKVWETGQFNETVTIETKAGTLQIPVRLNVLKPRPTFAQIAHWYLPLLAVAAFPALSVAFASGGHPASIGASLVPPAVIMSGMLSAMLLLICVANDTGIAERLACGVLLAVMMFVLGVAAGVRPISLPIQTGLQHGMLVGIPLLLLLLVQARYPARWQRWSIALVFLGLLSGGAFLNYLFVH